MLRPQSYARAVSCKREASYKAYLARNNRTSGYKTVALCFWYNPMLGEGHDPYSLFAVTFRAVASPSLRRVSPSELFDTLGSSLFNDEEG